MTFISYAQNFEDAALWRALHWFTPGFYIDVGANDPTEDSVTRAFYERDWQGINIEPVQTCHDALCRERPRDVNLRTLAGDGEGSMLFSEYPATGRSTAVPEYATEYAANLDLLPSRYHVPMRTLSSICEEYVEGDIHFLKIDVEGFEGRVLRGMDWRRWRPWIVLVETPFDQNPEWASLLPEAGYRKVRFDGLNTFYLAEEHLRLAPAFEMPPSMLDQFRLCRGHALSYPIAQIEGALVAETVRAETAERRVREIEGSRWFRLGQRVGWLRRLLSG